MDQLVKLASAKLGVGEDAIRSALGTTLNLIKENSDTNDFGALVAKLPGAEYLLKSDGSLLSSLSSSVGGGLGSALGAVSVLGSSGLDSDKVGDLMGMFSRYAREQAGDNLVDRVMDSMPGLDTVIG